MNNTNNGNNSNTPNTLPTLTVQFNHPLKPHQLRSFRGAVIERALQLKPQFEAAGLSTDIWHQHVEREATKLHYRYPLIQYQLKQGMASITAIGKGVAALKIWLQHNTAPINWAGQKVQLGMLGFPTEQQVQISIADQNQYTYRLYKWIALNQHNYKQYRQAQNMYSRLQLLQQALQNHLVALSFTLLPGNQQTINCEIIDLTGHRHVNSYKGKLLAFDAVFSSNIKLPHFIGIGKGVSIGFGKQQPVGLYQSDDQKITALMDGIA